MSISEGVPFARALSYLDPAMFYLIAFMAGLLLYSILTMLVRRKLLFSYVMLLGAVALAVIGGKWFDFFSLSIVDWANSLKLIPLLFIAVGCVLNIVQYHRRKIRPRKDWHETSRNEGERRGARSQSLRASVNESRRDKRYAQDRKRNSRSAFM